MTPERWSRVQEVFAAALEREPSERKAYVAGASGIDEELRREVESLLASHSDASSQFLGGPIAREAAIPRRPMGPGTRLGSYEIVSSIGAGGMGEVYRARDTKLKRDVAIKVLPPALANDPEALARFEREALAVAALSHPNILSIFDFGTHDGIAYSVTELLEGETLRSRLDLGPIPPDKAVDFAQQMAKGLSAAHERGVVHRDLKPENIFVSKDGHLKILDFGLAKREEKVDPGKETSAPTASGHTQPGTVMGTVGYMSPEQVRGLAVDHRSDIFSFGTVLYEMLSGRRAFKRDTAADTMSAILKEDPPEISDSSRRIPAGLDRVVRHCLEKDRDRRFQSAQDLQFALTEPSGPAAAAPASSRRALVLLALLAAAAIAGVLLLKRSPLPAPATPLPTALRIAVLPFENLGDPKDDYFADGMADEIRGKLTSLPGIEVVARASSVSYRKSTKQPQEIAKELDVPYLLMATVRWDKSGPTERVIVRPELVRIGAGSPKATWGQPFDAAMTDVFHVQSDIASRAAKALGIALGAKERHELEATPTGSLDAYDAFLRGEEARGKAGSFGHYEALGFYEQAVALDPKFTRAWAGIAQACAVQYMENSTLGMGERARLAAEKAAALQPRSAIGQQALGDYWLLVLGDANRAHAHYARAVELEPDNADALAGLGGTEAYLQQWDSALKHLAQARRLDPRVVGFQEVAMLVTLRRFTEALSLIDLGLQISPANFGLVEFKIVAHLAQGDLSAARKAMKDAERSIEPSSLLADVSKYHDLVWIFEEDQRRALLKLTAQAYNGNRAYWAFALAQAAAIEGERALLLRYAEVAREDLAKQLLERPSDSQNVVILGVVLAYLGRKSDAIRETERALAMPAAIGGGTDPYINLIAARTYTLLGEHDRAVDQLEVLLKSNYHVTPAWLGIDTNFDPLRGNPRFEKLVTAK